MLGTAEQGSDIEVAELGSYVKIHMTVDDGCRMDSCRVGCDT